MPDPADPLLQPPPEEATASLDQERTPRPDPTPASAAQQPALREAIGREQPGRYQILRELARGGQGVVSVAWDQHLGREVAFKQLLAPQERLSGQGALTPGEARFVREARITAQLDHPGIAPVHEVGRRADGSLYATQKLVRGKTLAAALAECKTPQARLGLLQPLLGVFQAVAFAHGRGVVHRDLKPANVLLGDLGEVVVIDWGLGRTGDDSEETHAGANSPPVDSLLASDAGRTASGALIGTPAYMSPEQAVGGGAGADARADVWSLGVILYELLTGQRPFRGPTQAELLRAVATVRPRPVRALSPEAPTELAAVAERALQRDPELRYPSARELAAELSTWLSGGRVAAHDYTSWELLRKFAARNKTGSAAALAVLLALGAAGNVWRVRLRESRHALAEALLVQARAAALDLRWGEAAAGFAAARVQEESEVARLGLGIAEQLAPQPLARLAVDALDVGFLPDGRAVAVVAAGDTLEVRAVAGGGVIARIPRAAIVVGLSKDGARLLTLTGRRLATGGEEGTLELWPLPAPGLLPLSPPVLSVVTSGLWQPPRPSPDGRLAALLLLAPDAQNPITVIGLDDGRERWRGGVFGSLDFAPDGRSFLSTDEQGSVVRVSTDTFTATKIPSLASYRLAFAQGPGGATFATDLSGRVAMGSVEDGAFRTLGDGHRDGISRIEVAGDTLATASADLSLRLWSLLAERGTARVGPLPANEKARYALDAAGERVVVKQAGEVVEWRLATARRDWPSLLHGYTALAISADGRRLARSSAGRTGPIQVVDTATGRELFSLPFSSAYLFRPSYSLSADGSRFAALGSGPEHAATEVWELQDAAPRLLGRYGQGEAACALSPDGRLLAGPLDGGIAVWRVGEPTPLSRHRAEANAEVFSADGARIAWSAGDGNDARLSVAESQTGRVLGEWNLPDAEGLAISPDGTRLAGGYDHRPFLLDIATGTLRQLEQPDSEIWSAAFSPDGRWLALSGTPLGLFDGHTGATVLRLPNGVGRALPVQLTKGERMRPFWVAFLPDGSLVHAGPGERLALRPALEGDPEQKLREVLARYRLRIEGQEVRPER